jgi:hypothetical protein
MGAAERRAELLSLLAVLEGAAAARRGQRRAAARQGEGAAP